MAEPLKTAKPAVTGKQLALIGVLAVILVAVLAAQFGVLGSGDEAGAGKSPGANGSPASNDDPRRPASAARAAAPAGVQPERASAGPQSQERPWPRLTAEAAARHNPFAVPEAIARKAADQDETHKKNDKSQAARHQLQRDEVARGLRAKGVRAVLRSGDGAAAVLGTQVVRVGDVLDGFRVISIDTDGVLLAPSDSPNRREDRP